MRGSPPSPSTTLVDRAVETDDAEDALVARARHDPHAFAPLYDRYFDAVYRYCYHRLGNWDAAEDATSLVFTNAIAALPRYRRQDDAGSFRAWLFAIAHNVVANRQRHTARHPHQPLAAAAMIPDTTPSPEDAALAAESHRTVWNLLSQLPEDQRRLLELRLAGLTNAEIAQALGRSRGAVRASQFRAVNRLRRVLGIGATPKEAPDV